MIKELPSRQQSMETEASWFGYCLSFNGTWAIHVIKETMNSAISHSSLGANLFFSLQ